jgi:hypothetical protein
MRPAAEVRLSSVEREGGQSKVPPRPTAVGAALDGLRLVPTTAAATLPAWLVTVLVGALGNHVIPQQITALAQLDPAALALRTQVLGMVAGFFGLYLLVQVGRKQGGSKLTPESWVGALLFMPTALFALAHYLMQLSARDYAVAALMLGTMGFNLFWLSAGGALILRPLVVALQAARPTHVAAPTRPAGLAEVFAAHATKITAVQIGMQLLIPGLFFARQFAFADLLVVLKPGEAPLDTSRRLTWVLSSTLYRLILLFLLLGTLIWLGGVSAIDGPEAAAALLLDPRAPSIGSLLLTELTGWFTFWWMTNASFSLLEWRLAAAKAAASAKAAGASPS